jgi:vacuolar-type H+-ATPase subunit I/STV1
VFDRLRAAVNAALDAAMPPPDWRDLQGQMRRAAVDGRAALMQLREALSRTERELAAERAQLAAAQRRGTLAEGIDDSETVEIAQRFTAKHGERVAVLEQKLAAQQAELALAERDVGEMVTQLKEMERRGGIPSDPARPAVEELQADDSELRTVTDRAAREADAAQRLEALKKRMGK